jgi:hypothetical protein
MEIVDITANANMNYCKLHSFVGSEQDSKDCSECYVEREKEVPFLANLRVDDEKCMYCGGEGAMCQKCKEKFSKTCPHRMIRMETDRCFDCGEKEI